MIRESDREALKELKKCCGEGWGRWDGERVLRRRSVSPMALNQEPAWGVRGTMRRKVWLGRGGEVGDVRGWRVSARPHRLPQGLWPGLRYAETRDLTQSF